MVSSLTADDPFLARIDHLLAVGDAAIRRDHDWNEQLQAYRQKWLTTPEEAFRRDESRPRIQRFPTGVEKL